MSSKLYHLVPKSSWHKLVSDGAEYYPATYSQDGFIHLTKNPSLLLSVANHFYQDVPGEFVGAAAPSVYSRLQVFG